MKWFLSCLAEVHIKYNTAEQTLALMHSPPVSYTMPFPTQAIVRVADAGV